MAKVIWAADEQNGRFLRRRNSLVSLRILLRCSSSNSAILLILASKALSPRAAGVFRFADVARIERDFKLACLTIEHIEERATPVMKAGSDAELLAWCRAFGLAKLLDGMPPELQRRWEAEVVGAAHAFRKDAVNRLGGVTRLVVATI